MLSSSQMDSLFYSTDNGDLFQQFSDSYSECLIDYFHCKTFKFGEMHPEIASTYFRNKFNYCCKNCDIKVSYHGPSSAICLPYRLNSAELS